MENFRLDVYTHYENLIKSVEKYQSQVTAIIDNIKTKRDEDLKENDKETWPYRRGCIDLDYFNYRFTENWYQELAASLKRGLTVSKIKIKYEKPIFETANDGEFASFDELERKYKTKWKYFKQAVKQSPNEKMAILLSQRYPFFSTNTLDHLTGRDAKLQTFLAKKGMMGKICALLIRTYCGCFSEEDATGYKLIILDEYHSPKTLGLADHGKDHGGYETCLAHVCLIE